MNKLMSGKWKTIAHKAAKSTGRNPVLRSSMIEGVQVSLTLKALITTAADNKYCDFSCADPENFVRGGPTLTFLFI